MLKGLNLIIIIIFFINKVDAEELKIYLQTDNHDLVIQSIKKSNKKRKKTGRKAIREICKKSKRKIKTLENKARRNSTPQIQRCKRAYSELRYQACHLKKYNQRKIDAAKNCKR